MRFTTKRAGAAMAAAAMTLLPAAGAGAAQPPAGSIKHVVVINLENEAFASSFGPGSKAPYLAKTLTLRGVLVEKYYGTAHVSLPNYVAELSGQGPTPSTQLDCGGTYADVSPGSPAPSTLGQVLASQGCVYPAAVRTIAGQLDALHPPDARTHKASWRGYFEDMGNDPARDGGSACAHPASGAANSTQFASAKDGYAARHNPFVWFHSLTDKASECQANVLPLGSLDSLGKPKASSPLVQDLSSTSTTPAFAFISPSLCNDGHDATCTSKSAAGGSTGGLAAADAWLKAWMPTILGSPAYKEGSMLVVVTFDEAEFGGPGAADACCSEKSGPNVAQAGINGPGGGQVGALVLASSSYIRPGSVDSTGTYNHYSALRTYEDLLGITSGGTDGHGHLGMAGATGLKPFGADVFNAG